MTAAPDIRRVPIASVLMGQRQRAVDPDVVAILRDSIEAVGQLQPIGVQVQGDGFLLVYGAHRLTVQTLRGEVEIDAVVFDGEIDKAAMELAENYVRKQMSPLEISEALSAQKLVHEAKHPITRRGMKGAAGPNLPEVKEENEVPAYTSLAATQMGVTRKQVYAYLRLQQITPALRMEVREHLPKLAHTLKELLALAALPPKDQAFVVKRLRTGDFTSVNHALSGPATPKAFQPDAVTGKLLANWKRIPDLQRGEMLRAIALDLPPGYAITIPAEDLDKP